METQLRITSVGYSRLVSLGNYENEKHSASALVEEGQNPEEVREQLKTWVCKDLIDVSRLREEINELADQRYHLNQDIFNMKERLLVMFRAWDQMVQILAAHNADVPERHIQDVKELKQEYEELLKAGKKSTKTKSVGDFIDEATGNDCANENGNSDGNESGITTELPF